MALGPARHLPYEVEQDLGALREHLASAYNVERLLQSKNVGAKALRSILPELADTLPELNRAAERLAAYVEHFLGTDLGEVTGLLAPKSAELSQLLSAGNSELLGAKARLGLERSMNETLLLARSVIEHLELAVEATWLEGVETNLSELLLSASTREGLPSRPFVIAGEAERVSLRIPARVAARALSLFAATHNSGVYVVSRVDEHYELRHERTTTLRTTSHPLSPIAPLPSSPTLCRAVFQHYGIHAEPLGGRLAFPIVTLR